MIRQLNDDDSLEALTQLLHRAYAPLAAMGFNYTACDQSSDVTAHRVEKGECYVAIVDRTIVGTVTLYKPGRLIGCDWYNRRDTAAFGQFAVDPSQQCKSIGSQLLAYIESRARALGYSELGLDTAEGATQLVRFYIARGYRIVDRANWDGKMYQSLVMSKSLGDKAL